MSLVNEFKKLALGAYGNQQPMKLVPAEIMGIHPLTIRLERNNKLIIPSDLLTVAQHLREHTRTIRIDGEDKQIRFYSALSRGDQVMVVVLQGGQSFFILDKI